MFEGPKWLICMVIHDESPPEAYKSSEKIVHEMNSVAQGSCNSAIDMELLIAMTSRPKLTSGVMRHRNDVVQIRPLIRCCTFTTLLFISFTSNFEEFSVNNARILQVNVKLPVVKSRNDVERFG